MTVLYAVYNSEVCVGRCDAKCYNATHGNCDCICGGKNHGVGIDTARANIKEMFADMLDKEGVIYDPMIFQLSFEFKEFANVVKNKEKNYVPHQLR